MFWYFYCSNLFRPKRVNIFIIIIIITKLLYICLMMPFRFKTGCHNKQYQNIVDKVCMLIYKPRNSITSHAHR
jgi:uncharacterized protein YhhL (DUF1145 family)